MKKKILLLISIFAFSLAVFSLTACGGNDESSKPTTPVDVDIPYVSEFVCDYYTTDGKKIEDKTTAIQNDGDVRVKIGFTISPDALTAGKEKFAVRFVLPDGFTGRIVSANTSTTSDKDISAVFMTDEKSKKCEVEASVKFTNTSGTLCFGYSYDDEEGGTDGSLPLVCDQPFVFTYDEATDGYVITKDPTRWDWLNTIDKLTIPTTFADKPITALGSGAFCDCNTLTEIVIPDTVTSIGKEAFSGCVILQTAAIPNGVTSIGESAFENCAAINGVVIPGGVTAIEKSVFSGCFILSDITIPDSVTSIGDDAFYKCHSLANVTIPGTVTEIGAFAFYGCRFTSVVIPAGITEIEQSVFEGCGYLNSVTILGSVTSIGSLAFGDCEDLTEFTIPSTVTSIGSLAFASCGLTSITIPDSATSVAEDAFDECPLNSATIPANAIPAIKNKKLTDVAVTSGDAIPDNAFVNCYNLANITLPDTITSIGDHAFEGCAKLTSINLPSAVTSIGEYAFSGCGFTSYAFPSGITSIPSGLFSGCTALTSVTFPSGVTSIPDKLFSGCVSLANIEIPDGVTSIGSKSFYNCSKLAEVTIPSTVTSIGNAAFDGCPEGKKVYITSLEAWCKTEIDFYTGIGWSDGSNPLSNSGILMLNDVRVDDLVIPDGITKINAGAFVGCGSIKSVTIQERVTAVGSRAFGSCPMLKTVTVSGETSIAQSAFENSPVYTAAVPASTDFSCFDESELTVLTITSGASIADFALSGYYRLHNLTIADSVETIGEGAFYNCNYLNSVKLGNGIKTIGRSAFQKCSNMIAITIPSGVTSIEYSAFSGCTKLNNVNFGGTTEEWKQVAAHAGKEYSTGITVTCSDGTVNFKFN